MKKFFCLLVIVFCAVNISYAQKDSEFGNVNYRLGIGPYIGYKLGINAADVPSGYKNGVSGANIPDFGAQFFVPFEGKSKMGLIVSAAYVTNPYIFTYTGAGISRDTKYNISYIALGADFFLSGFTVGFNYGFISNAKQDDAVLTNDLFANLFELKIGGQIPMMENDLGRLNLIIQGGYIITSQYNVSPTFLQGRNTNPASIMIGVSYLFNIDDKQD